MLTPLRSTPFHASLLALSLATASLAAFPTPSYAGPCEVGGALGCGAEGENPGNSGNPGNGNGGNQGGNNGPGTGPDDDGGGGFVPGEEGVDPPAAPDTDDTIAKAFNQIEFPVPTIETAPNPKTFVRIKTSFWIPAAEAEDITVQASVGAAENVQPQTITATAQLKHILWDLVEDEMICEGPGRPGGKGTGGECDYTFKTSSSYHGMKEFKVTATPHWHITWTCTGTCLDGVAGVVEEEYASPEGEIMLLVDEIQTEAKGN